MDTNLNIVLKAQNQGIEASFNNAVNQFSRLGQSAKGCAGVLDYNQRSWQGFLQSMQSANIMNMSKGIMGFFNNFKDAAKKNEGALAYIRSELMGIPKEEQNKILGEYDTMATSISNKLGVGKSVLLDAAYELQGAFGDLDSKTKQSMFETAAKASILGKASVGDTVKIMNSIANNMVPKEIMAKGRVAVAEFIQSFQGGIASMAANTSTSMGAMQQYMDRLGGSLNAMGNVSAKTTLTMGSLLNELTGDKGAMSGTIAKKFGENWATAAGVIQRRLGISVRDVSGNYREMGEVLTEVSQQIKGYNVDQKEALYSALAAGEKLNEKGVWVVAGKGNRQLASGYRKILGDYEKWIKYQNIAASGLNPKNIDDALEGILGSAERRKAILTQQAENAKEALGKIMSPAIFNVNKMLTQMSTSLMNLASKNPELVKFITKIGTVFAGGLIGVGSIGMGVGKLNMAFQSLKGVGLSLLNIKTQAGQAFSSLGWLFKPRSMPWKEGQIGPAKGFWGTLFNNTAISKGLTNTKQTISGGLTKLFSSFSGGGGNMLSKMFGGTSGISQFASSINQKLSGTVVGGLTSRIGGAFKSVNWRGIGSGIGKGMAVAGGLLTLSIPLLMKDKEIGPMLQTLFKDLKTLFAPVITDLLGTLKPVIPVLGNTIKEIVKSLMPIVVEIVKALIPILPVVAEMAKTIISIIMPLIPPIFEVLKALIPIVNQVLKIVTPILKVVVDLIRGIFKAVFYMIPEGMLSSDQKFKKYMMLASDRKGDKEGQKDAAKQGIAWALEQFGIKDVTYANFEEDMKRQSPALQAAVQNILNNSELYNQDPEKMQEIVGKTLGEGKQGRVYDLFNQNKLIGTNVEGYQKKVQVISSVSNMATDNIERVMVPGFQKWYRERNPFLMPMQSQQITSLEGIRKDPRLRKEFELYKQQIPVANPDLIGSTAPIDNSTKTFNPSVTINMTGSAEEAQKVADTIREKVWTPLAEKIFQQQESVKNTQLRRKGVVAPSNP